MSKKRLLILGAGRGQIGLYKAVKEMGLISIAGTMPNNNPPGIKLADEVCYMDISDVDEVFEKVKELRLDGIATCCLDAGVPSLGKVCSNLGLVGLSEQAAEMCKDKAKMKKAFMEHNVSTAQYYEIYSDNDLDKALEKIQLPVIIKATDLGGSRGIYIAKTKKEAQDGFHEAMKLTKKDYCIVEEYIEGWEFGAQAFVYNGKILFVMPHGDETYMTHTAVPVGHYVPFECDENTHIQIEEAVTKAIRALGLNNCAVNVDLIMRDGKVYVIELTGRVGANCLPELVEINYGIEYYKMIAAMAIGDDPLTYWDKRNAYETAGMARMLFSTDKRGKLENIKYDGELTENIVEITFFRQKGDEIRIFDNSNDCIGQVIVKGDSVDECADNIKKITSNISISLE